MVIVTIMLKSLKISEAGQVGEFLEQVGHEVYLADGQIEIKLFLALHPKYYYHSHFQHQHHHHQYQYSRRRLQNQYGPLDSRTRTRTSTRVDCSFSRKYLENL